MIKSKSDVRLRQKLHSIRSIHSRYLNNSYQLKKNECATSPKMVLKRKSCSLKSLFANTSFHSQKIIFSENKLKILEKRNYIVSELIESEKNYLTFLIESLLIYRRCFVQNYILPINTIHKIFFWLEEIINLSRCILRDIDKTHAWKVYANNKDSFSQYTKYPMCYQNSIAQIDICRRMYAGFDELIVSLSKTPGVCCGLSLESILLMPIQRIPRYELLFKKLSKTFQDGDRERSEIRDMKKFFKTLNRKINTNVTSSITFCQPGTKSIHKHARKKQLHMIGKVKKFIVDSKIFKENELIHAEVVFKYLTNGKTQKIYFIVFKDIIVEISSLNLKSSSGIMYSMPDSNITLYSSKNISCIDIGVDHLHICSGGGIFQITNNIISSYYFCPCNERAKEIVRVIETSKLIKFNQYYNDRKSYSSCKSDSAVHSN